MTANMLDILRFEAWVQTHEQNSNVALSSKWRDWNRGL